MGCGANRGYAVTPATKYFPDVAKTLPTDLSAKTIAITGTTSGTGYATARFMLERGATLIMLNRPSSRSTKAEEKLKEEFKECKVTTVPCDLQSFASVREAASKVLELTREGGLDVLGLNAGIMAMPDNATKDGCDVQMQTNHLSHFLLTALVFPSLEKAANARGDARVVSMTSLAKSSPNTPAEAKFYGKNGGNLGGDENKASLSGPRWERYHQTKLANCIFTYALADKIEESKYKGKIKAVVAHPGLSATNLQITSDKEGSMPGFFGPIFRWLAMSPTDGAAGFVIGCLRDDVANGSLYGPTSWSGMCGAPVLMKPEPLATTEEVKKMLWSESEKSTECEFKV
uniref:Protochlorophyllide reductase n=1 Tax=Lotharella globosa TaxID=91324 RepID=A0A7S3Z824_9EUKA|mmetsp:Transcript_13240/g.25128  ORF Transcript_13240/g.25128 Transcript_13240/m.25128 type:complete len:345 (+) Transcript_13240:51-1085(+)|eukprot:CAMPEP_0167790008 /NCGR_PEP_ID=MMETSP0111_2-20121227/11046_1 /TAXON_ID=91324 /ORGANISM="Lotharella globosa, Strain CCCM811" /LENGTH=344 /DNA_ID=CAMNT_0007682327 /DNA_START=26 /DNA_END=1060 /DNA_ORIENTATION=-